MQETINEMNNKSLPLSSKYLFEQLCTETKLLEGWIAVKRNRGTSGIDGQTTDDFDSKLHEEILQLKTELQTWQYQPQPVRRVEIPKPGSKNDKRNLGIPTVRDRVVQAAIKQLLEPILDPLFSANSYGFRPGKNQRQAVEAAQEAIKSGNEYIVDIDLSKFFDRINQDRLIARLSNIIEDKRILKLIGMMLRGGVMQDGLITPTTEGAIQGSPLSPLLSNLVLDELDKEIEKRGLKHCRFADDCNIFVKTTKAAERVMQSITKFIEKKLKLKVNQEKSKVAKSSLVKFLGMTIIDGTRAIAKKSLNYALKKVKELTPRGTSDKLEVTIKCLNTWYTGWSNYYSMTQYPSQLDKVEAHMRRRLRSRIVSQQKTRRHLCNKLMKRGVNSRSAAKTCFSNNGRWKLSHTNAVERAYPNSWFIEDMKLKIKSRDEIEDWFGIRKWVCLV